MSDYHWQNGRPTSIATWWYVNDENQPVNEPDEHEDDDEDAEVVESSTSE